VSKPSDPSTTYVGSDEEVLLLGITGSTAYGLAHGDSDIDRLGIYCVPTTRVLGLDFAAERASRVFTDPDDVQLHEISKFLRLALKANPTITELLYLDSYEVRDERIEPLIEMRSKLLGQRVVRSAYAGYAMSQAERLTRRSGEGKRGFTSDLAKRTEKHGRHCFRLMLQCEQLLHDGEITVDLSAHRDELFAMGELAAHDVDAFRARFEERKQAIDLMPSDLPLEPDLSATEAFLVAFRRANLD